MFKTLYKVEISVINHTDRVERTLEYRCPLAETGEWSDYDPITNMVDLVRRNEEREFPFHDIEVSFSCGPIRPKAPLPWHSRWSSEG